MRVLFKFILLLFILQITVSVSGQVTSKEKRYRKKMLKKAPSGKTPLIIVDSDTSRTLTPEEFLTFSDSIDFIFSGIACPIAFFGFGYPDRSAYK